MRLSCTTLVVLVAASVAAAAPVASLRTRLDRPRHGEQVRLTPFVVPARAEREVCQAVELRSTTPLDVTRLRFASPAGRLRETHHFALFLDDTDPLTALPHGTVDAPGCVGFGANFGAIVGGVPSTRATLGFPPGVGLTRRTRWCS
jgi:hypothetical protein